MKTYREFASLMSQARELVTSNRPMQLRLDLQGGITDDLLLPQRVTGTETLCGGIEYRMLCVSTDDSVALKRLIAVPAALEFVTDTGELRSVCGIITEASAGDSDGGLASYQLVLRDALAILEKRINTRVFRNMDEVEIVRHVFYEWRHKSPILGTCLLIDTDEAFSLREYPQREFTMQHNESDAAFIRRLLRRRGIGWYIRAGGTERAIGPMHTLVLFNDADSLRRNAAHTVRYHRDSATEERDAITSWTAIRTLQAGMVSRHSWDYRHPLGGDFMMAELKSSVNQGVHGNELAASLDDYQVLAPHNGDDSEDLLRLGQLRMNRHDYESKCFHGEGSVRDFCAGEYFTLAGHPEVDTHPAAQRDFVLTALRVQAQNNLPKALAERVERLFARSRWGQESSDSLALRDAADAVATGPLRIHVQFTAVRRGVKIVPAYDVRTDLPAALMQSAIVVGPKGEEVHCDQLGRVKIRFPGMRPEDHVAAAGAGASDSDRDSAWVRVASNWAGNGPGSLEQCGTVGLPRVGTEVLVNFLGGDPDRPVIVGQLFNQVAEPPALSSAGQLPGNRYLSGIKSREIKGGRANQLRFDDTKGEISAQLGSDHGASQLNLGWLVQPRVEGHADARGEGIELRTDLKMAVRGEQGVLITAEPASPSKETHLERSEMIKIAENLQKLIVSLSEQAELHTGDTNRGKDLSNLIEHLKEMADGAFPIVAVSAPSGMISSSKQNIAIGAGTSIDIASGGATYLSAGDTSTLRAVKGISLFSNEGGANLIAASGKVAIKAQNGDLEMVARRVMELISSSDWITIKAKKGVRINGGGSELEISAGGIKGYTEGKSEMYAADHQTFPGNSRPMQFPGDVQPHKICVPCLLIAAEAHSPFALSR